MQKLLRYIILLSAAYPLKHKIFKQLTFEHTEDKKNDEVSSHAYVWVHLKHMKHMWSLLLFLNFCNLQMWHFKPCLLSIPVWCYAWIIRSCVYFAVDYCRCKNHHLQQLKAAWTDLPNSKQVNSHMYSHDI